MAHALNLLFHCVFVFLVLVFEHFDPLKHLQITTHALIGVLIRISIALRRAVGLRDPSAYTFVFYLLILFDGLPIASGWFSVTVDRMT